MREEPTLTTMIVLSVIACGAVAFWFLTRLPKKPELLYRRLWKEIIKK